MSDTSSADPGQKPPAKPPVSVVTKPKSPPVVEQKTETPEPIKEESKPTIEAVDPDPIPPPAPPPPPKPEVVAPPPLSHSAQSLKSILQEYIHLMDAPIVNEAAHNRAIRLLARASEVAITNPADDVRDVMWNFHVEHQQKFMREDMALRGIRSLDKTAANMVSATYSLFRHKVTKSGLVFGDKKAIELTSQRLVAYLSAKP